MKIILSPAKKMREHTDDLAPLGLPVFLEDTKQILAWLRGLSYAEMKKLLAVWTAVRAVHLFRMQLDAPEGQFAVLDALYHAVFIPSGLV